MSRLSLFLDFDDVICLNNPWGGYDAKHALSQENLGNPLQENLWAQLFDSTAKENLRLVHEEWAPLYVISSTWWFLFDKEEILLILERTGLSFVAQNLHENWATPKRKPGDRRSLEIGAWLNQHPEMRDNWVILDDMRSGKDILHSSLNLSFVVLCQESVGLQTTETERLHQALKRRSEQQADA